MTGQIDRSEAAILAAAIAVFARHGYVGASVQRLVAATGRSRSSLYGSYGDKAGLFVAALEQHVAGDPLAGDGAEADPWLLVRCCLDRADLPAAAVPILEAALEDRWVRLVERTAGSGPEAVDVLARQLGRSALLAAGVPASIVHGAGSDRD